VQSQWRSREQGVGVWSAEFNIRSDNLDQGAPVGIEELLSQAEERRKGGIEYRMEQRSANPDRGDEGMPIPAEQC